MQYGDCSTANNNDGQQCSRASRSNTSRAPRLESSTPDTMQHAAAGDRAFVDEDYKGAIDHYSKVTKAPSAYTLHQHVGSAFSCKRLAHLCLCNRRLLRLGAT
jgi:hypothetical protein